MNTKLLAQPITREINKFLREQEFPLKAKLASDFGYVDYTNTIYYALVLPERHSIMFYNYAMGKGLKIDCGCFIVSLFHEIGHHKTIDVWKKDDLEEFDMIKKIINSDSDIEAKKYFSVPDENLATEWAVDYINNHSDIVEDLIERIQPLVDKFYTKVKIA